MVNLITAAAVSLFFSKCNAQPSYNCDPCINRADHVVKAILQRTKSDPFWQQIKAAMRQSEKDMRVQLEMELYDNLDTEKVSTSCSWYLFETPHTNTPTFLLMHFWKIAADIRAAANSNNPPEALIVSIPSENVKAAVSDAIESGLPVFGMYSG